MENNKESKCWTFQENIDWRLDASRGVGWPGSTMKSTMAGATNAAQHRLIRVLEKFPFPARGAAGTAGNFQWPALQHMYLGRGSSSSEQRVGAEARRDDFHLLFARRLHAVALPPSRHFSFFSISI